MNWRVGALFAAGVAVAAALVIGDPRASSSTVAPPVAVTGTAPRPMALGRIEPVSELIRVAGPTGQDAGRIATLVVAEGDWVQSGAVLAVLDTRERLQAAVDQARATLALRRAQHAKTIADLDNQDQMLTAALEQQEAQRDRARWELDRLGQLQRSGIYRDTALIDKRLALEAQDQALASARHQLERNRHRGPDGVRVDEAGARAEIAVAEAALKKAEADLGFSAIRAPIEGRIIRRMGRVGEQVGQEGLVEIADTRVMRVRAEVFESDLRRVRAGQGVLVTSRALDTALEGRVTRVIGKVSRQSIVGDDPAASLDARVVEVMIELDSAASTLTEGLSGLQVIATFQADAGA